MAKSSKGTRYIDLPLSTSRPLECALTGASILRSSYFNRGSAFTDQERAEFDLVGLLPSNIQTLEEQAKRAYEQYKSRPDPLAKNTFMTSMMDQNGVLFYRLLQDHLKEMFSVIYTPTEGDAIHNYSRLFRKPHGCFLDINRPDDVEVSLARWGHPEDIDVIVVSDGEQILGIGDQGVGGILISAAKLILYTLCAGIHPHRTLPVVLDCGTNSERLLNDELYLGNRHERIRGQRYDDFVDKFVQAARRLFPRAYLHFEDFGLYNARRILDRYTGDFAIFNDDVQGTGCVSLAALMAALHVCKVSMKDVRIVIFGAGTAGTGIADQIAQAICVEIEKPIEEARKQIWCVDKPGLLLQSQKDKLTPAQKPFARDDSEWGPKAHENLLDVVKEVKPHVLIGTSTKPGAFTEEIVVEMASHVERPVIFPLSNPTKLHEAVPKDLFTWTKGKALVATGSPFDPVEYNGTTYDIAECNNSECFPGIGLGAVLCRARLMTDKMLVAAVKALAKEAPALHDDTAALLPDVTCVRELSVQIAMAVIKQAVEDGLNEEKGIPDNDSDLEEWVREQMWYAEYRPLKLVGHHEGDRHARGKAGPHGSTRT